MSRLKTTPPQSPSEDGLEANPHSALAPILWRRPGKLDMPFVPANLGRNLPVLENKPLKSLKFFMIFLRLQPK